MESTHKKISHFFSSLNSQLSTIAVASSMDNPFDPDLIHAIFKHVWLKRSLERQKSEASDIHEIEVEAGTSKKNRPTSANANAVKLSCELLRIFITEAIQRAAIIAEAEGVNKIEATHLERILPQLLLDF